MKLIERFENFFIPEPNSGCWLWAGNIKPEGYGAFQIGGATYDAHRISYVIFKGAIPRHIFVCHLCDTKACVNPTHLRLGTNANNMRDAGNKGLINRGENNKSAKLNDEIVRQICALYATGKYSQKKLGKQFGVAQQTISDICRGDIWWHITNPNKHSPINWISAQPHSTLPEQFDALYIIDNNGCWIWQGEIDQYGYGQLYIGGSKLSTHRLSYELFNGEILPKMDICHSCDVKHCVNPNHLWMGTHRENMQDASKKGIMPRGERAGQSKLKNNDVIEMIGLYKTGNYSTYALGKQFGIDASTAYDVIVGNTWKHIDIDRTYPPMKRAGRPKKK